ncbi:hypothetical protein [Teredinibacter purpureus]|nr:hypothetical protein [Teredinibacter purpureus]
MKSADAIDAVKIYQFFAAYQKLQIIPINMIPVGIVFCEKQSFEPLKDEK